MVLKVRRHYTVEIDADGIPGWNGPGRPEDITELLYRTLPGWYNPVVTYTGEEME